MKLQYILYPCSEKVLIVIRLQGIIFIIIDVEKIFEKGFKLPTLPSVFTQISKLVKNSDSSIYQISEIISSDLVISTRVLRLVNSAFYGYEGEIKTIRRAVVILGLNTLKDIVLTVSVFRTFSGEGNSCLNKQQLWEHSILVGVISSEIARLGKICDPEEAFTAGILHDIGKLIFDRFLGNKYDAAFKLAEEKGIRFYEAESLSFGINHAGIAKELEKEWKIPRSHLEVMISHHVPELSDSNLDLVTLVHVANNASHEIESDENGFDLENIKIDRNYAGILGLHENMISDLMPQIKEKYNRAKEFINIASGD